MIQYASHSSFVFIAIHIRWPTTRSDSLSLLFIVSLNHVSSRLYSSLIVSLCQTLSLLRIVSAASHLHSIFIFHTSSSSPIIPTTKIQSSLRICYVSYAAVIWSFVLILLHTTLALSLLEIVCVDHPGPLSLLLRKPP